MSRLPVLLVVVLSLSCATELKRRALQSQAGDYEYAQPLDTVWPAARAVLKERGYSMRDDGKYTLVTDWREVWMHSSETSTWQRFLVRGWTLAPLRSTIRVYRQTRKHGSNLTFDDDRTTPEAARDSLFPDSLQNGPERDPEGALVGDMAQQIEQREMLRGNRDYADSIDAEHASDTLRDLEMEWSVFSRAEPDLARKLAGNDNAAPPTPAAVKAATDSRAAEAKAAEAKADAQATTQQDVQAVLAAVPAEPEPLASPCGGPSVAGAEALLSGGPRVLLLGGVPGTFEIPEFAGALACAGAARGLPVTLALEIPRAEAPALARFLASDGGKEARRQLLLGAFWHRPYEDGRSSVAVLQLLERLRAARQEKGLDVDVLAFDTPAPGGSHDALMAQALLAERVARPERLLVVMTGNVHARTRKGVEWNPGFEPLGLLLKKRGQQVLALDADHGGGMAWSCKLAPKGRLQCGSAYESAPLRLRERFLHDERTQRSFLGDARFVHLGEAPSPEGFDGLYYVGLLTPAVPAARTQRSVAQR